MRNNAVNKREITLCVGKSTFGKSRFASEYLYGYNRVIIFDPLIEHEGKYFPTVGQVRQHVTGNPVFRVTTDCFLEFDKLCKLILDFASPDRRAMFCIDEITRLALDPQLRRYPAFQQINFAGGHSGIDIFIIAQRASTIPISCRSQWTQIITFRLTEPDDLDYFKSVSRDQIMDELPILEEREYIKITNRAIEKLRS
jgi:hypothetical protein